MCSFILAISFAKHTIQSSEVILLIKQIPLKLFVRLYPETLCSEIVRELLPDPEYVVRFDDENVIHGAFEVGYPSDTEWQIQLPT